MKKMKKSHGHLWCCDLASKRLIFILILFPLISTLKYFSCSFHPTQLPTVVFLLKIENFLKFMIPWWNCNIFNLIFKWSFQLHINPRECTIKLNRKTFFIVSNCLLLIKWKTMSGKSFRYFYIFYLLYNT